MCTASSWRARAGSRCGPQVGSELHAARSTSAGASAPPHSVIVSGDATPGGDSTPQKTGAAPSPQERHVAIRSSDAIEKTRQENLVHGIVLERPGRLGALLCANLAKSQLVTVKFAQRNVSSFEQAVDVAGCYLAFPRFTTYYISIHVHEFTRADYKYSSKLLYEITVFMVRVKVRKTKSLKLSSAAARP